MKKCSDCNTKKDGADFSRNSSKPDGRDSICKPCRSERNRHWRERHKDYATLYAQRRKAGLENGTWQPRQYRTPSDTPDNSTGLERATEGRRKPLSAQYKTNEYAGGNDVIDRLIAEHWPGERVWMVNGPEGRKPICADTREEAEQIYDSRRSKDSVVRAA